MPCAPYASQGLRRLGCLSSRRADDTRRVPSKQVAAEIAATHLTSTTILLNHFRAAGIAPDLSRDVIAHMVNPLPREEPEYLSPTKLQKLLEAAQRHDGDEFARSWRS